MTGIFSVAIDGPAGAGKSTVARAMAERCRALYIDTGAMYRAVGLYMKRAGIDVSDEPAVRAALKDIDIKVEHAHGAQRIYLNCEDVTDQIRNADIAMAASLVSQHAAVRRKLVEAQRLIAAGKSVVMDGRDIGTKVLPDATLKIYLVADAGERARRRLRESLEKGLDVTYEDTLQAILKRDEGDMNREESPLRRASDAVLVDSTSLSREETVEVCLKHLAEALAK